MIETTAMTDETIMPDMDAAEHARDLSALSDYVRVLADRMGLKDWTFEVEGIPADVSEVCAPVFLEVVVPASDRRAVIFASEDFFEELPERRRSSLVMQLLYCHTEVMTNFVLDQFDRLDRDGDMYGVTQDHLDVALSPIARAWASCLPLPLVGLMRPPRGTGTDEE